MWLWLGEDEGVCARSVTMVWDGRDEKVGEEVSLEIFVMVG